MQISRVNVRNTQRVGREGLRRNAHLFGGGGYPKADAIVVLVPRVVRLGVFIGVALFGSLSNGQQHDATQNASMTSTQTSLAALTEQINAIANRLNNGAMQLKKERAALARTETTLSRLNKELRTTQRRLDAQEQRAQETLRQKRRLEEQAKQGRKQLSGLVVEEYKQGGEHYTKQLLNQENPYTVGRLAHYRAYFSAALKDRLDEHQTIIAGLTTQTTLYEQEREILEQLRAQQADQAQQLNAAREQRATTIKALDTKLVSDSQRLARLEEDRTRLTTLLENIQAQALITPTLRPDLTIPGGFNQQRRRLTPPVQGQLVTGFNERIPSSGLASNGLSFSAQQNTEVTAIFEGIVIFSGYLKGYGQLIIIDHGDQYLSLYGHNQALTKQVGDRVRSNEVIAQVGDTGGLKSPGLYFELRHLAQPINPAPWFAQ